MNIVAAFAYLNGFVSGFESFNDPETLRKAIHTITYYMESLEMYSSPLAKKKAKQDTEDFFGLKEG